VLLSLSDGTGVVGRGDAIPGEEAGGRKGLQGEKGGEEGTQGEQGLQGEKGGEAIVAKKKKQSDVDTEEGRVLGEGVLFIAGASS